MTTEYKLVVSLTSLHIQQTLENLLCIVGPVKPHLQAPAADPLLICSASRPDCHICIFIQLHLKAEFHIVKKVQLGSRVIATDQGFEAYLKHTYGVYLQDYSLF